MMTEFLNQMAIKAKTKAIEMAGLELSIWNEKHETGLKENFGFTDSSLRKRKQELQNLISKSSNQ
jgi:hypothetical protein